jgi:hypothetical protein
LSVLIEYTKNKKIEILICYIEDKHTKKNLSNFKMSRNVSAKKPYCKICHDAGKPEKEYTNHMLKDRNGKTVCPTLLNTECRFCHKLGHTAKFCDAPKKKEKKEKERSEYKPKPEKTANSKTNISNKFQGLSNDDNEIDPNWKEPVASWASIASKPQKIVVEVVAPKDYVVLTDEQTLLRNMYRRNWAEWPDSEDDE